MTAPPAYDQPESYETIESAMCSPIGRGSGGTAEDLYSLGVTLLTLLLGYDPIGERSQQTLLEQKIEMGSYTALVGQARVPISVMEAIARSCLTIRYANAGHLVIWKCGLMVAASAHVNRKCRMHSSRPFNFMGRDYIDITRAGHVIRTQF